MSRIIDDIDALVDEQLSGYSERSGYDYNVNQQKCWHCGEDWHGLKITARMREMRAAFWYGCRCDLCQADSDGVDSDYSYATDDSEVLCPGSDFIGPWATKRQIERMRTLRFLGDTPSNPWVQLRSPGDPVIERAERPPYSLAALQQILDATYAYAFPQRYVLGIDNSADGILGAEASQVIIDEGRPFDFAGALRRILDFGDPEPEPDTRTPQERALPRPSTTPPMWAVDAGRQRRTRTNSRRRHR